MTRAARTGLLAPGEVGRWLTCSRACVSRAAVSRDSHHRETFGLVFLKMSLRFRLKNEQAYAHVVLLLCTRAALIRECVCAAFYVG